MYKNIIPPEKNELFGNLIACHLKLCQENVLIGGNNCRKRSFAKLISI